jgi:hypothetical protein
MSAAPPPPPPPPPRGPPNSENHFEHLPAELLLIIHRYAGFNSFLNLALAIYPTLRRHNLIPELTSATLDHFIHRPNPAASKVPPRVPRLPDELWLLVAQYMEPVDIMSLVFALGPQFAGPPNRETRDRLRVWSRRCRKK